MLSKANRSMVVKNIVNEVMNGCFPIHNKEASTRILALLAFNEIGVEQGISTLKHLNKTSACTRIFAEEGYFSFGKLHSFIELSENDDWTPVDHFTKEIEDEFDQLFIPVASFSLVSELVHFFDSRPLAKIIQRSLLKGIKVTMVEDIVNPYSQSIGERDWDKGTSFLKNELFNQLKKLQGFGVTLIHSDQVKSYFQRQNAGRRALLTEEEVIKTNRNHQKEIFLSSGTLITPLARDTARNLGIRLTLR